MVYAEAQPQQAWQSPGAPPALWPGQAVLPRPLPPPPPPLLPKAEAEDLRAAITREVKAELEARVAHASAQRRDEVRIIEEQRRQERAQHLKAMQDLAENQKQLWAQWRDSGNDTNEGRRTGNAGSEEEVQAVVHRADEALQVTWQLQQDVQDCLAALKEKDRDGDRDFDQGTGNDNETGHRAHGTRAPAGVQPEGKTSKTKRPPPVMPGAYQP